MTAIVEKELVHAPLASANSFLETFFATHAAPKGEGARILLHAGEAAHSVIVTLQPAHRPEDMTPRYRMHWEAENGGPYPAYDGELSIGADEDYDAFWLVLDGAYAPPGGPAGKVFDVVIGRPVAAASAHGLLTEIRAEIEVLFSAQERAKLARLV
jgi:hypothetical protein